MVQQLPLSETSAWCCVFVFLCRAYSLVDSSQVSTFLISILLIVYGSFRWVYEASTLTAFSGELLRLLSLHFFTNASQGCHGRIQVLSIWAILLSWFFFSIFPYLLCEERCLCTFSQGFTFLIQVFVETTSSLQQCIFNWLTLNHHDFMEEKKTKT